MTARHVKLISLFLAGGGGSGLVTIFLISITPWTLWLGVGLLYLLGLGVSLHLARKLGWLRMRTTVKRYNTSALIIVLAYPVSVLVMLESLSLYDRLYRVLFAESWERRASTGGSPETEGFYVGLLMAALVSASLVSIALRLVSGKWDNRAFVLMLLAAAVTVPLSLAILSLIRSMQIYAGDGFSVMFVVGEASLAAVSGYWLSRQTGISTRPDLT